MHYSMKKRKQYEKVVDFFYGEEGLFFYVASIKEDKVLWCSYDFESLFLKLAISEDISTVNFNKVAVLPDVAKILKKNNIDFDA